MIRRPGESTLNAVDFMSFVKRVRAVTHRPVRTRCVAVKATYPRSAGYSVRLQNLQYGTLSRLCNSRLGPIASLTRTI